ncbi:MAG: MucB/RseB C-terminal domain-containing protein [Idiomarina sp.]|nr:MucB/RseB C-terminal domain-containing protein [Idiomarina sp.]
MKQFFLSSLFGLASFTFAAFTFEAWAASTSTDTPTEPQAQEAPEVLVPNNQVPANQTAEGRNSEGAFWFDRMQTALRELNFSASFVTLHSGGMEAYRWVHGVTTSGDSIEIIAGLNGPENQAIRMNNRVTYFSPVISPYSLHSQTLSSPIPSGLYERFQEIRESYDAVPAGGGRVVDRAAQHIRLVSRSPDRYLYSLWIDRDTGMLLSVVTFSTEGDVLEQVLLTSINVFDEAAPELEQISEHWTAPPEVRPDIQDAEIGDWQFEWLPAGFQRVRQNRLQVALDGPVADHYMYSDGLAKFSVYVSADEDRASAMQYEGITSLYSHDHGQYTATVVGRIPLHIAQRIAASVRAAE